MRYLTFVTFSAMAALLAACGGASSGGITPQPVATATPPVQATQTPGARVEYSWQGALAPGGGTTIQGFRRTLSASPTPIPVQATLCDPRVRDCRPPNVQQYHATDINPYITVTDTETPPPSAAPTMSPPPGLSVALEKSSSPNFTYQMQTPAQAGCANIGVTFPGASGTVPVCTFHTFLIGCIAALTYQPGGGYDTSVAGGYSFDAQTYTTDIASSDVYMKGPNTCPSAFAASNVGPSDYEVYFPYGATAIALGGDSIATVSPTQWANSFTQLSFYGNTQSTCGGTLSCLILLKTRAGNIVAMEVTAYNAVYDGIPADANYNTNAEGNWFNAAYSIASGGSFAH